MELDCFCRFIHQDIKRIRLFLTQEQCRFWSRLLPSYASNLFLACVPAAAVQPLQYIQNAAAWLVFNLPKFSYTTLLLGMLHWLLVAAGIQFKTLVLSHHAEMHSATAHLSLALVIKCATCSSSVYCIILGLFPYGLIHLSHFGLKLQPNKCNVMQPVVGCRLCSVFKPLTQARMRC